MTFELPNEDRAIYVTFDDGPHPEITPWVLEELAKRGAKATFFLIGRNADKYPHIVDQLRSEGHGIGNHTQNHPSGWKTKDTQYLRDVSEGNQRLKSNLFRPPYGQINRSQSRALRSSYHIIMWSDLSADFDTSHTVDDCVRFATQKVKAGSIIVFHDSEKAWPRLKEALPRCLDYYQKHDFLMKTIPC